jgi:hypothetical protein
MTVLQRPFDRLFRSSLWAATILAIAAGAATMYFGIAARSIEALGPEAVAALAAFPVHAKQTWEVERTWKPEPASYDYIASGVGPPPCAEAVAGTELATFSGSGPESIDRLMSIHRRDPSNLLLALVLATEFQRQNKFGAAERVANETLPLHLQMSRSLVAAHRGSFHLPYVDESAAKLIVHLYYAQGVSLLSQEGSGQNEYVPLRLPIAVSATLEEHGLLGALPTRNAETIVPVRLARCAPSDNELSTGDLYNNLLVAYAARGYTARTPSERPGEFEDRLYNDSPEVNPMLALMRRLHERVKAAGWRREEEGKLWAVSNAERVLRANQWRPRHALLALNIARLIEEEEPAFHGKEPDATLQLQHDALLAEAVEDYASVAEHDRKRFANQLALALSMTRNDATKAAAEPIASMTSGSHADVIKRFAFAARSRGSLGAWFFTGRDSDPADKVSAVMGSETSAWLRAAKIDTAVAAAKWGNRLGPRASETLYCRLRQLTRGTSVPEVEELGKAIPERTRWWLILSASPTAWIAAGLLIGALLWLFLCWLLIEIRRSLAFRTSFYQVEMDYTTQNEIRRPGVRE